MKLPALTATNSLHRPTQTYGGSEALRREESIVMQNITIGGVNRTLFNIGNALVAAGQWRAAYVHYLPLFDGGVYPSLAALTTQMDAAINMAQGGGQAHPQVPDQMR